jgi:hypothetical protein
LKKYIYIVLLTIIVIIFGVGTFNYKIDSAGVYKSVFERKIATEIVNGKNIIVDKNINDEVMQKEIINALKVAPDIIALGSSRAKVLTGNDFNSNNFRNNGVSGASLEDYVAILGMYDISGKLPKEVIFVVDPWIFNKNNGQLGWQDVSSEANYMLGKINGNHFKKTKSERKLSALFSLQYALENYRKSSANIITTTETFTNLPGHILRNDGSIKYGIEWENMSAAEIEGRARGYCRYPIFGLDSFDKIDDELLRNFLDTINYLKEKKINVVILLPPYHPIVYKVFSTDKRYRNVLSVENTLKQLSIATVVGSYNPQEYNYINTDFYDGHHPRSLKRILMTVSSQNN